MKSWNSNTVAMAVLFGAMLGLAGCNKTSFKREDRVEPPKPALIPPVPADHTISAMGMGEAIDGGTKKIATIDKIDFVIQAADSRLLDENVLSKKQPLDLYFALDMTASMGDEMNAVKEGISRLADELSNAGIDMKVGVIGFVDSFSESSARTFKLSSDIAAFKKFIEKITPKSNEDFPEASLYAGQQAISLLQESGTSRPDALKALVMIADVIGHNGSLLGGGSPARDCNTNKLVGDINSFAGKLASPEHFKFFYTVPDPALVANTPENAGAFKNCAGNDDATGVTGIKQMQGVLDAILPAVAKAKRGGPLLDSAGKPAWPLTQNNLVNTLVPMLSDNITREDVMGSCLARSAVLYDGAKKVYSWTPEQMSVVNDAYKNPGNELRLPNVLGSDRPEGTVKLDLKVERCCVTANDIKDNNFNNCFKSYTQTIKYEVTSIKPVPQYKKR
jgi:hypothetical protein